jgi:hypothetical protein
MTTQAHYPTSEELAKLRLDLSECRHGPKGEAHDHCPLSHPEDGGAWPWEAETTGGHGIGARDTLGASDEAWRRWSTRGYRARREAAALRHAAYAFLAANVPDLEA